MIQITSAAEWFLVEMRVDENKRVDQSMVQDYTLF